MNPYPLVAKNPQNIEVIKSEIQYFKLACFSKAVRKDLRDKNVQTWHILYSFCILIDSCINYLIEAP